MNITNEYTNPHEFSKWREHLQDEALDALTALSPICHSCERPIQHYEIHAPEGTWGTYYARHTNDDFIDVAPDTRIVFIDRSLDDPKPFEHTNAEYADKFFCSECVGKCDSHRSLNYNEDDCDEYVFFHNANVYIDGYPIDGYDPGYNMDCYEIRGTIGSDKDTLCMGCYEQIPHCGYCGTYFDSWDEVYDFDESMIQLGLPSEDDVADLFFTQDYKNKNPHKVHFLAMFEKVYREYTTTIFLEDMDQCCYCIDKLKPHERNTHLKLFAKEFFSRWEEPFDQSLYDALEWQGDEYALSVKYYDPKQTWVENIEPTKGYVCTIKDVHAGVE